MAKATAPSSAIPIHKSFDCGALDCVTSVVMVSSDEGFKISSRKSSCWGCLRSNQISARLPCRPGELHGHGRQIVCRSGGSIGMGNSARLSAERVPEPTRSGIPMGLLVAQPARHETLHRH